MSTDRVVLDVGGTTFVTTKTTLSAWTNFFDLSSSKTNEPIFVDADPDAFQVLLSFMRHGSVEASRITDVVLKQAIHFQIKGFLAYIRNIDVVKMNVRGTRIETSKKLLIQHSHYFRDKFATNWATELDPFLNQDPTVFRVCLEFMTRGHLERSKLSNEVLELADILGIKQLVNAAKTRICWMGNDENSLTKFNQEYGTISNAITTCRGGSLMQQPPLHSNNNTNIEHVSVYLHKKPSSARTSLRLPFRACVFGRNVSPELLRMGDTINVFNKLAREGFALAPPSLQTGFHPQHNMEQVPGLGRILAHVLFVKQQDASRKESLYATTIIDDTHQDIDIIQPKEFVALLRPFQEVHSQSAVRLAIPSSDSAPSYWSGSQLRDAPDPSVHGAITWLVRHDFLQQEPILTQAFTCALEGLDEHSWASVTVFSKPISDGEQQGDTLPTVIESVSLTSSITDNMSLENGH